MPCVSLPNGASSLPPKVLPLLERFDRIYLWMDDDVAGQVLPPPFFNSPLLSPPLYLSPPFSSSPLTALSHSHTLIPLSPLLHASAQVTNFLNRKARKNSHKNWDRTGATWSMQKMVLMAPRMPMML
jgi:hypothetical protein